MEVPQSPSPSAPLRLWAIAAHWDVVARRHGAAGLRGCGASRPCDIGAMGLRDCGTAWPWGCGTSGMRGHGITMHGNGAGTAPGRVGGVRPCGRGVSERAHPRGAHGAVGLWDIGTVGLWDCGTMGLRRRRVPGSVAAAPCKRGPRARGRGAGLGRLIRRTPRAGQRRRGARPPKAVTM